MDTPGETGHRETLGPSGGGTIRGAKTFFSLGLCERLPRVLLLVAILEKIRRLTTARVQPFTSGWFSFPGGPPLDKVVDLS
jgi:hypothetical protein